MAEREALKRGVTGQVNCPKAVNSEKASSFAERVPK